MTSRTLRALALASVACAVALSTTTDASALAGADIGCSTTAEGFPVCMGIADAGGGGGGPSVDELAEPRRNERAGGAA